MSASRAAKGRPRLGREATDCATARTLGMRLKALNAEQFLADRLLAIPWRRLSGKSKWKRRVAIVGLAVKPRFDNVGSPAGLARRGGREPEPAGL